ncbi:MAG: DUF1295 domain-containing protein [Acidimicrobiales bacterium]
MEALLPAALAIAALMIVVWIISLVISDASIVDIAWGFGFVVVAWTVRLTVDGVAARQNLMVALVSIWGLRLAGYLAMRNLGHGEDPRYQAMRRHHGPRFPIVSLLTVFALQGVVMFVVSLPVTLGQAADSPTSLGPLAWIGALVWLVGFGFEAIGDAQMRRFQSDPANNGQVMDRGLWGWTRHPNYFGDATMWFGLWLIALETGWSGVVSVVGPVVMTYFLLNISGKALLERSIGKRRPGYADYVERTSGFFPRPPKQSTTAG